MVLLCISVMSSDVGGLYVFFGKMSIHVICPCLNQVAFMMLSFMGSLYILDINSLSDMSFANIFSHSVGCLFVLLIASFVVKKPFDLM